MKVLVVDDEDMIRELIVDSLITEYPSLVIDEENCGKDASNRVSSEKYDLLITDLQMPNDTDFDILDYISENKIHLKSIIISGFCTKEELHRHSYDVFFREANGFENS